MKPERWRQIEPILERALELTQPERRAAFVAEACAGDDALRREVETLIASYEEAGSLIEKPILDEVSPRSSDSGEERDAMIGERVGAYRIVRELGRGGMGAVYEASRADSEFQKRVAIKLIKRGMDTDFILRRFRNERQILAALDHPNIALMLDGGSLPDGRPYFVMEYIEGRPLNEYCDIHQLPVAERLRLFQRVCSAVAYAHQNLVIHRDLKPSNVLVTEEGMLKLLDFGIAKLLNPELADGTLAQTTLSARLMTPEYASPEQAQGLDITPSSDQYSLGVMLYELVTGHRPYRLRSRAPLEMMRVVCEEEPERPSVIVTREEESAGQGSKITPGLVCANRNVTLERLRRELEKGFDNVILKALRKNPSERYPSVAELSADIERYLEGRPVQARAFPPAKVRAAPKSDEATTRPLPQTTDSVESSQAPGARRRGVRPLLLIALAAVASLAAFIAYKYLLGSKSAPQAESRKSFPSQQMTVRRLTTLGRERLPAISPDGRLIAHVSADGRMQSLRLREGEAGESRQIIGPAEISYIGISFSPDSRYLYYAASGYAETNAALYRVPVTGGAPEKILEAVGSAVTFSPDGRRFAYLQNDGVPGEMRLVIVNTDDPAAAPQVVARRRSPDYFYGNPEWSPDGRLIACPVNISSLPAGGYKLVAFHLDSGAEEIISARAYTDIPACAWLHDTSGLIMSGSESGSSAPQLWFVPYPAGEPERITNDLNDYRALGLAADSATLVVAKRNVESNLWVALTVEEASAPQSGSASAREVTKGVGRQDGINGVRWTPQGRILYVASAEGGSEVWVMDADGTNRQRLPLKVTNPASPSMTPDGRYVVLDDYDGGHLNVWRFDAVTGERWQLTEGDLNGDSSLTPDGQAVVYVGMTPEGRTTLRRVSINGGASIELAPFNASRPVVSPDGRFIACSFSEEGAQGRWRIAVLPVEGGAPVRVLDLPASAWLSSSLTRPLAWSADSRSLFYINYQSASSNVWRAPVDGGASRQVTHFADGRIFNLDLSTDGRRLALARGTVAQDIVLFKNLR